MRKLQKIMVAMSGGVDSSMAAALLKEQGYDLIGVTLRLYDGAEIAEDEVITKTCCSLSDVEDARRVAARIGFRHVVFSFTDCFRHEVIDRFTKGYEEGRTPNPCIDCNRYIKFSKLLERARQLDMDGIATGHYARVEYDERSGRYLLKKARDVSKDQTYVLYMLTQEELSRTLFPLGDLLKSEVRQLAEERGLVNARKPDSQDICFVPNGDYASFIEKQRNVKTAEGDFLDTEGHVIGRHKGHIRYTVGQRKGLGVSFASPRYVVKKDAAHNTVTLGKLDDLYTASLIADDVNWIAVESLHEPMEVQVKTRYHQTESPATLYAQDDGSVLVKFAHPQRAVTPGQAVVFYSGDVVVGGGTIR